ncbi:hypothetical protein FAGKG844_60012 [Frankia sp. AgKG'84/4]
MAEPLKATTKAHRGTILDATGHALQTLSATPERLQEVLINTVRIIASPAPGDAGSRRPVAVLMTYVTRPGGTGAVTPATSTGRPPEDHHEPSPRAGADPCETGPGPNRNLRETRRRAGSSRRCRRMSAATG